MKAKTWCLIGLTSIVTFFCGCGEATMSKNTNFKWYAVATAPREYPMEIISGTFFCKGMETGIPIPSGGTLTTGWGKSASAYVGSDEVPPLPDRVQVTFFSYVEKQAYKAEFLLPYENILAKFQQRLRDAPDKRNYSHFILGVAPGGAISVWLGGPDVIEVFFGQAEKIEIDPALAFELPFKSKEQSDEYVNGALKDSLTSEQIAHLEAHGVPIGTWSRYRNLYRWSPIYKEGKTVTDLQMSAEFLNGESYWIPTIFNEEFANTPKPLPLHLEFSAQATRDDTPFYVIDFDPIELMEAFEKLGANGEKVFIEFDPRIPVTDMKIRVYNDSTPKDEKTPKEYVELKKFNVDP